MIDLSGKRILITGASSGIGMETAKLCDLLGAETVLVARREEELKVLSERLVNRSTIHPADLTKPEEVEKIALEIEMLDGVVHCTGKIFPYPIKFIRQKQINDVFSTNVYSAIELTSHLFTSKKIAKNASFVFLSSISVKHPYMGGALYTSSKAALESFSKTLALEYAKLGIRSNCVAPALVQTEIVQTTKESYNKEDWQSIVDQYPLGIGNPIDVANMIAFLLSEASSWITGNTIPMDGGLVLNSKK